MLVAVRALIRCASLMLSFAFSTLAAASFVTFALFLGGDASWLQDDLGVVVGASAFLGVAWVSIAQLALLPALGILLVAEFSRASSFTMNLLAGGVCALIILALYPLATGQEGELPYAIREIWLTGMAAGFVAGLVHWALAGHRAGRWMGVPRQPDDGAVTGLQ